MVGDVISGIKFLFDAIRTRNDKSQQYRKELFTNFVEPIYEELEVIHKSYMETFQSYRTQIETTDTPMNPQHPVFASMQKDHAFTDTDRAKLAAIAEELNTFKSPVAKEIAKIPEGHFAQNIINYITAPPNAFSNWGYNAPRKSLLLQLKSTNSKEKAIELLDSAVEELQEQYVSITREYMKLKSNLLA